MTDTNNFLTATSFSISLDSQRFPGLSCAVQTFNHPSVSVDSATQNSPRRDIPLPGSKLKYNSLSVTLIAERDLASYEQLYQWLKDCVILNDNPLNEKLSDIRLNIYSAKNNLTKTIIYSNAFPTEIGELDFTVTDIDDGFVTYDVTFEYTSFEIQ